MLRTVKQFGLFKKLTFSLKNSIISDQRREDCDLIFIRHAESEFNTACQNYRVANKIPYVWKELCNHQGFDQKVLFNLKYIDCSITPKGKMDCLEKRKLLENQQIDAVLVSPQMRALQTSHYLFKNRKVPFIVQPLLVGPLRSCCDINKSTQMKKLMFPNYNFSATKKYQALWYLDYLSPDQKQICLQRFKQKGLETLDQKRAELVNLLKEGKIYEDPNQYRKRIDTLKQRIEYYRTIFSKIAIVSHYYTIQYISAKQYMENGAPKLAIDVQNCTPYYSSIEKIKNKHQYQT